MNQIKTAFVRFQKVLGRGLAVALESYVTEMDCNLDKFRENLGDKFDIKIEEAVKIFTDGIEPGEMESQPRMLPMSIRHSGTSEGGDLFTDLVLDMKSEKPLTITFRAMPIGYRNKPSRLNIRQRSDRAVLGLAFARFPASGALEENSPFYAIKDRATFDAYINLDCLSNSQTWNPLFVKYHLAVADAFKANEYGYLRIDVNRNGKSEIVVKVSRVQESEVPDTLKTAETLPR